MEELGTLESSIAMSEHNKYRCEHSFDREQCEFCNPQLQGETHFGGVLTAWDMDDDNPLLGELPSKEEIALRKERDKKVKLEAKQKAKEEKMQLTKMKFEDGEEYDPETLPTIDDLPF